MKARASGTPAKFDATPGERHQRRAEEPRQPAQDDRVGEQEAEDATGDRGDEADLDAVAERARDDAGRQVGVVAEA